MSLLAVQTSGGMSELTKHGAADCNEAVAHLRVDHCVTPREEGLHSTAVLDEW